MKNAEQLRLKKNPTMMMWIIIKVLLRMIFFRYIELDDQRNSNGFNTTIGDAIMSDETGTKTIVEKEVEVTDKVDRKSDDKRIHRKCIIVTKPS